MNILSMRAGADMVAAEPQVVWDVAADLGEGPVWVDRDRALWFVDIKKQQIHRYDPWSKENRSWIAPEQVSFVFPAERGGFVVGLQSGLCHFDETSGRFALIVEVEPDLPGNRLNDGVVDAQGRLWFGTMDNGEKEKTGAFYLFAGGKLSPTGIGGIAITNGPAISPDGRLLYCVDTLSSTIDSAAIGADGSLGERRPFVQIEPRDGYPDGPTIDINGFVWISLYGGWEARRYAPSGELVQRMRFPVANVTKVAFGGDGLRTAFATTARQKMNAGEIAEQPQIGHLFQFEVDVPGVPCPLVGY
jgi:D-xylonolactonase